MATFVPSTLRVEEIKPDARLTKPSVARISRSTSRCWLPGSTVKVFINVTMLLSDVWLMGNASFRACGRIVGKKGHQSTGNEMTGPMGGLLTPIADPLDASASNLISDRGLYCFQIDLNSPQRCPVIKYRLSGFDSIQIDLRMVLVGFHPKPIWSAWPNDRIEN
jgi:hypothetical protein